MRPSWRHSQRENRKDPSSSTTYTQTKLTQIVGFVENPEDLTPLQPSLSPKEMLILLDNAESILDPQGTGAQEIYAAVEKLSDFSNIFIGLKRYCELLIRSRNSGPRMMWSALGRSSGG